MKVWAWPQQDEVVMDYLEDLLVDTGAWVGSWYPEQGFTGPKVIVLRLPSYTQDETRYGQVEVQVECENRGEARQLATEVSDALNDLAGRRVRSILVDDVIENAGPQVADNIDDTQRTYTMVYSLGFRKQLLPEGEN